MPTELYSAGRYNVARERSGGHLYEIVTTAGEYVSGCPAAYRDACELADCLAAEDELNAHQERECHERERP